MNECERGPVVQWWLYGADVPEQLKLGWWWGITPCASDGAAGKNCQNIKPARSRSKDRSVRRRGRRSWRTSANLAVQGFRVMGLHHSKDVWQNKNKSGDGPGVLYHNCLKRAIEKNFINQVGLALMLASIWSNSSQGIEFPLSRSCLPQWETIEKRWRRK